MADLNNLSQLSQKNPGEKCEVSWISEGITYTLSAYIPVSNTMRNKRTFTVADMEWSLHTRDLTRNVTDRPWTQSSADLELIINLLALLPEPSPSSTASTPGPGQPEGNYGSESAPLPQSTPAAAATPFPQEIQAAPATLPRQEQAAQQALAPGVDTREMMLSGEINEVDFNSVLQSIALKRMTGCLEAHAGLDEVFLYFEEGALVHAIFASSLGAGEAPRQTGERVLLELLLWDTGKFDFRPGKKAMEFTVNKPLQVLLSEGAALQIHLQYLKKNGMTPAAVISRTRQDLSRDDFDRTVRLGIPIDLALQQRVYIDINGSRTLQEIVSKYSLPRQIWIPLFFNLHNSKLISFASAPAPLNQKQTLATPEPDSMTLARVRNSLMRSESGMMSYELFYHFLQMEFERTKRENHIFSILVFSIVKARNLEPLSVQSLPKLTEYVEQVKEPLDLLAHFRDNDFIILCPGKDKQTAATLAGDIANLLEPNQIDGLKYHEIKLAFGVANVPKNTRQLLTLISQAEAGKNTALSLGKLISICEEELP